MSIQTISGALLKDMFVAGAANIRQNCDALNALNVFPVPDGDTGSNMSQTISAAIKEMNAKRCESVAEISDAVARGALRGARGNSGVILSQILRGFAKGMAGCEVVDYPHLVAAFREAALTAYKAVMKPKEGTILTVIRVISEDVGKNSSRFNECDELFRFAVESGDAILKRTPEMLPILKQAGVVDSGGMGLMLLLKGMYAGMTGEASESSTTEPAEAESTQFSDEHADLSPDEIKFAYCTEFIVSHPRPDMTQRDVSRLRSRLDTIGDCVLVISDLSVVKVHVHTNEPGRALGYALELGELDAIKIDNMLEEAREREAKRKEQQAAEAAKLKPYGIVSVALGEGFSRIFGELHVEQIVDGGQTMNPSIQDLAQAIEDTHAQNVFVLPNNTNIILAAQQAKELTEKNVIVLPTKSVPMGIAAVLAFNPDASVEENTASMTAAAENVHTASFTYAVRDTVYDGKDIRQGDIMGMIDNQLKVNGDDLNLLCFEALEQMVTEDTSLITLYYGEDVKEEDAQKLCEQLETVYPDCDVEVECGGQPLYYYLIAVE